MCSTGCRHAAQCGRRATTAADREIAISEAQLRAAASEMRQAMEAADNFEGVCCQVERQASEGASMEEWRECGFEWFDPEDLEVAQIKYRQAIRKLKAALPVLEMERPAQATSLEPLQADAWNSMPCLCGSAQGRMVIWPWMLQMESKGFCAAGCDKLYWRRQAWGQKNS